MILRNNFIYIIVMELLSFQYSYNNQISQINNMTDYIIITQMQILETISQECNKISANPKSINSINQLITTLVENIKVDNLIKLRGLFKIINLLHKFYNKTKSNQSSLNNFIQQKASVMTQIILSIIILQKGIVEHADQQFLQNMIEAFLKLSEISSVKFSIKFYNNLLSSHQKIKDIQKIYSMITSGQIINAILSTILEQSTNAKDLTKIQLQNILIFLLQLPHFNQIRFESQQISKLFKKNYQSCLLRFLQILDIFRQLAIGVYRKIGDKILSKMANPLILSDYFLNKFQQDPQIQIEVLSCLFILVGKYNLEFQNFYQKLQKLIQSRKKQGQSQSIGKSIYQLPNSRRFFKLVESALRTSKVPFKTISSMCKIIIRQILQQESQFTFWALSFFVNLTKKHRRLLDEIESIPQLTLLKKHYSPQIRALVGQLRKDLNKSEYLDIDQFSKINIKKLTNKKLEEVIGKLNSEQDTQFRIPALWEDL